MKTNILQDVKNSMAESLYGKTVDQAVESGLCIQCGEEAIPKCYSEAGREEYYISALCEICFDNICKEPE